MDADAHLHRHLAKPAHELAGMHGGGFRREHACEIFGGAGTACNLFGRQFAIRVDAAFFECRDHRIECADLGFGGGGEQRAIAAEFGIDAMLAHKTLDVIHRVFRRAHQPHGFVFAEQPFEREELGGPGEQTAAVATARARAAEIAFDDDDVELRIFLLALNGGPQPGEAAADDAHIGCGVALQCRGERPIMKQGLLDPERAHGGLLRGCCCCCCGGFGAVQLMHQGRFFHVAREVREVGRDAITILGEIVPAAQLHRIQCEGLCGERVGLFFGEHATLQLQASG